MHLRPSRGSPGAAFVVSANAHDLRLTALGDGTRELAFDLSAFGASGATLVLANGTGKVVDGAPKFLQAFNAKTVFGTSERDSITAEGTKPVTLSGRAGNDLLTGGSAGDTISGDAGRDKVSGGGGADVLTGGGAADTLAGGGGADLFSYRSASNSRYGLARDTISDFSQADHDRIDLSAIDARPSRGGDDAFRLTGHGGQDAFAAGHEGSIRLTTGDGMTKVWLDINGDGKADTRIDLDGKMALTAEDFIL